MLIRQITNASSIKYLIGYGVSTEELSEDDYFSEFRIVLGNLDINKSKITSDYKFVVGSGKRIEKMKELEGHKLRDLVMYPEEYIKKINIGKSEYSYFKKQE